jgi:hypothetical protein
MVFSAIRAFSKVSGQARRSLYFWYFFRLPLKIAFAARMSEIFADEAADPKLPQM